MLHLKIANTAWVIMLMLSSFDVSAQISNIEEIAPLDGMPVPQNGNYFYVQVGAFKDLSDANQMLSALSKLGVTIFISKISKNDNQIYRVRAGPFVTQDAAFEIQKVFKNNGVASAVVIKQKVN
jgi:cell division septation protein DedD